MGYRLIIIFTFAAIFSQARSQLCTNPPVQVISNPLVVAPQVISNTIVDNSVSTALANTLQLLIVSEIIESKLGASCLTNCLNSNPTEPPCYPRVDSITPIVPCASSVEILAPCRPIIETKVPIVEPIYNKPYRIIEPCPHLGCSEISIPNSYSAVSNFGSVPCGNEIISPCLPNVYLSEVATPRNCYSVAEIPSPNFKLCNCRGVDEIAPVCTTEMMNPSYNPSCYGGYTDIVSPCNTFGFTDYIAPCCGGLQELVKPISPCNCRCGNVADMITPCNCFGGISEIINPIPCNTGCVAPYSPYCGDVEVISPIYRSGCIGVPESFPVNSFSSCRAPEIITPCLNSFPEVIMPTKCNSEHSCCEFCGPAAFSPRFCENMEISNPIGPFGPGICF